MNQAGDLRLRHRLDRLDGRRSNIGQQFVRLDPHFVAGAFVVHTSWQVASSARHIRVLRAYWCALSTIASLRVHYIGQWFNRVMPTSLGGDVAKVLYLRGQVSFSRAERAALLDRSSGLAILLASVVMLAPVYVK